MATNKYFTDASLKFFADKIKEYTDNAVSSVDGSCNHNELTNKQIDAILGSLNGDPDDGSGDSGFDSSTSTPDIELDGTLTQSGMAADAKVVGDRLTTKANVNHTHDISISNIQNLQTILDTKASSTHTHNVATTSDSGFMSSFDKSKLNTIESGANKTVVDSILSSSSINPVQNKVINSVLAGKASIEHIHNYAGSIDSGGAANSANKLNTDAGSSNQPVYFENGIPVAITYTIEKSVPSDAVFTDTTYSIATVDTQGLMSPEDKIKLDSIESNACKIIVDYELSSVSENPVQNKIIYSAIEDIKTYANTAALTIKNDLLNGAGEAYDTLKELGDLIDTNVNAIDALETVATGKADKIHTHTISDITDLQINLDSKATQASLGAHVQDVIAHITSSERANLESAYLHSNSTHLPIPESAEVGGVLRVSEVDENGKISALETMGDIATTNYVDSKRSSTSVCLLADYWNENMQTVSTTGVTASNDIIIVPAPTSYIAYYEAGIICIEQAGGSLTFTCKNIPTDNLDVNLLIFN